MSLTVLLKNNLDVIYSSQSRSDLQFSSKNSVVTYSSPQRTLSWLTILLKELCRDLQFCSKWVWPTVLLKELCHDLQSSSKNSVVTYSSAQSGCDLQSSSKNSAMTYSSPQRTLSWLIVLLKVAVTYSPPQRTLSWPTVLLKELCRDLQFCSKWLWPTVLLKELCHDLQFSSKNSVVTYSSPQRRLAWSRWRRASRWRAVPSAVRSSPSRCSAARRWGSGGRAWSWGRAGSRRAPCPASPRSPSPPPPSPASRSAPGGSSGNHKRRRTVQATIQASRSAPGGSSGNHRRTTVQAMRQRWRQHLVGGM